MMMGMELISTVAQWMIVLSIPFVIYLRFKAEADPIIKKAVAILKKLMNFTTSAS
jgi:hypothetical protein